MKTALTIAGSDPCGGAGLQADLRVFNSLGLHGLSVVSSLTAQNTVGVDATLKIDASFIEAQLECLLRDIRPDALKTGMVYSGGAVAAIACAVKTFKLANLVIDPVTISSSGMPLLEEGALQILKEELMPLARVITPNISEAAALSGTEVNDERDMEKAAVLLKQAGPEVVVITGGHLENETLDLVYDGHSFHRFRAGKEKGEYHGTGCAFSAALAAHLAMGASPVTAAEKAKEFVRGAILKARSIGKGMKILNV
jgi:hydroxymethylpyrimidine/phosphomethylpyrimidine kinase